MTIGLITIGSQLKACIVGYSEVRHLHPSLRLELVLLALAGKRVKIEKLASYAA
jgi:hypothetical protein